MIDAALLQRIKAHAHVNGMHRGTDSNAHVVILLEELDRVTKELQKHTERPHLEKVFMPTGREWFIIFKDSNAEISECIAYKSLGHPALKALAIHVQERK